MYSIMLHVVLVTVELVVINCTRVLLLLVLIVSGVSYVGSGFCYSLCFISIVQSI
jgi:hypothetical protein